MIDIQIATRSNKEQIYNLRNGENLSYLLIDERFIQQDKGEISYLILLENNIVIGQILIFWCGKKSQPDYPDLVDLYVSESKRGLGYGTQLIKFAENLVQQKSIKEIGLAVNPELNSVAYKLYSKLGYLDISNKKYLDGVYNGIEDWVVDMKKSI